MSDQTPERRGVPKVVAVLDDDTRVALDVHYDGMGGHPTDGRLMSVWRVAVEYPPELFWPRVVRFEGTLGRTNTLSVPNGPGHGDDWARRVFAASGQMMDAVTPGGTEPEVQP